MTAEKQRGFKTKYPDSAFVKALTPDPQTTSQIRNILGCSHYTASRTLKRLSEEGMNTEDGFFFMPVERIEINAGSGTGKMNLWKLTLTGEEEKKKLEETQEE